MGFGRPEVLLTAAATTSYAAGDTYYRVMLRPVLDSARMGAFSPATLVAVAPPMLDVLLVANVAGIAAMPGGRRRRVPSC